MYNDIFNKIDLSHSIVITSHQSPDGDSVGSSVALYEICRQIKEKKESDILIFFPDKLPSHLLPMLTNVSFIVGDENVDFANKKILNATLLFSLDYNSPKRVGESFTEALSQTSAFKIMIDHHLQPEKYADILISDTDASSTCQLLYEVLEKANKLKLLNTNVAKALYLGIVTDTGSFRYNNVKPKTHAIVSELLKKEIQHDKIHEEIIDSNTADKLKLQAYLIHHHLKIFPEMSLAFISVNKKEKNEMNVLKGDTEGLVNTALSIKGIKIAAFFSEEEDFVKISFRSKGKQHPVNVLANTYFNGGGHANASGGKYKGSLEECLNYFLSVIPQFV
ncbi:MAG: bifunctional oligoribonuclease/PAP phosphatase NrnA [Flavobacteriia bacterium]|nr:bifunctional oligoribonuclease/PAP phosphatase NrnA [Flavobacteriia bacterium]